VNVFARKVLGVVAAAVVLTGSPAAAQSSVSIDAQVHNPTVAPGDFQVVGCAVVNEGDSTVLVRISHFVTYADGDVQRFRHTQDGPITLGPEDDVIQEILFIVPADAAIGTATYTCEVLVVEIGGGASIQSDTATFEVATA
jgi:hypothetical protein